MRINAFYIFLSAWIFWNFFVWFLHHQSTCNLEKTIWIETLFLLEVCQMKEPDLPAF